MTDPMMQTQRLETRHYPATCRPASCGVDDCKGCRNKPALGRFKAWVKTTAARPVGSTRSPGFYVAVVTS
jgi:hypothetical protein